MRVYLVAPNIRYHFITVFPQLEQSLSEITHRLNFLINLFQSLSFLEEYLYE